MYNIGVDLGGTNIAAALVTEEGQIIRKGSVPTIAQREYPEIVKDMGNLCLNLLEKENIGVDQINSVGIGSPGAVNSSRGVIEYANNINFKNTPIVEEFKKYIDKPIYIENDANVAAYGEFENGAGKIYKDLVAITLGTGVGGGIIIDGKIIGGSFFGGAELGHIVIEADGVPCSCGRKGCWESYSSATGLIREAKAAAIKNPTSLLNTLIDNELEKMNAKIPFDAAQAGDDTAKKVIEQYIKYLAIGLVNVINIFQPEVIVLGGGVSAQRENLIEPLKQKIILEIYGGPDALKTKIKVAELGNDAGLIGAAQLYKLHF